MQKHGPLLEGLVERSAKLLEVINHPEAPLRVGMRKGIGAGREPDRNVILEPTTREQIQQGLSRLGRQAVEQPIHGRFVRLTHRIEPGARHADIEELVVRQRDEWPLYRHRRSLDPLGVNETLFGPLSHLDELHRPRALMRDQRAPLGPAIGSIVVINPAKQCFGARPVRNCSPGWRVPA
ncbi:hypothetical protein [Sphingomonas sp.]|uniref:hypothetical protein n=1 Tax=Sphingomonas sp. TaxID=28214 RepID=UPI0035BC2830